MNPVIATFAGLQIAPGPLFFDGKSFGIKDSWNYDSYEKAFGKKEGSTYFSYDNVKDLGTMPDGWRLPTKEEWETIITTDPAVREGSTVNGRPNAHWTVIKLLREKHAGLTGPYGLLLFPDGETITGKALDACDNIETVTSGVTAAELAKYLAQGCVFLPASGWCYFDGEASWGDGGYNSYYWSSEQKNEDSAYSLYFSDGGAIDVDDDDKSDYYYSCRLVK